MPILCAIIVRTCEFTALNGMCFVNNRDECAMKPRVGAMRFATPTGWVESTRHLCWNANIFFLHDTVQLWFFE